MDGRPADDSEACRFGSMSSSNTLDHMVDSFDFATVVAGDDDDDDDNDGAPVVAVFAVVDDDNDDEADDEAPELLL